MMAQSTKNPRKDVEETVSGLRRQARAVERRAVEEDPWVAAEMLAIAGELEQAAVRVIAKLREAGYPWSEIGRDLGIHGTTACKRYAKRVDALQAEWAALAVTE